MFVIKKISAKDCLSLRNQVLLPHKEIGECQIDGDNEETSFHLGALQDGKGPLAIASFIKENHQHFSDDSDQYRLRQMGVHPDHRRLKLGQKLIEEALLELKNRNASLLWCHARQVAYGFYESLGFEYFSSEFNIEVIGPHRSMVRRLIPENIS